MNYLYLKHVAYPSQTKKHFNYMSVNLDGSLELNCVLALEDAYVLILCLLSFGFQPRSIFLVDDKIGMADSDAVLLLTF